MSKMCSNCGKYPFCNKIVNAGSVCNEWVEDCKNCLGCNQLEDKNFKETKECKNKCL